MDANISDRKAFKAYWIGKILLRIYRHHFTMLLNKDDHVKRGEKKTERHLSTSNIIGFALIGEIKVKIRRRTNSESRQKKNKEEREREGKNCPGNNDDTFTRYSSGSKTTWQTINATHTTTWSRCFSTLLSTANRIDGLVFSLSLFLLMLLLLFQ